jgi:hypothetical protein
VGTSPLNDGGVRSVVSRWESRDRARGMFPLPDGGDRVVFLLVGWVRFPLPLRGGDGLEGGMSFPEDKDVGICGGGWKFTDIGLPFAVAR